MSLVHLYTADASLVCDVTSGAPRIVHYGAPLGAAEIEAIDAATQWPVPEGGYDQLAPVTLLPEASMGFPTVPGISGHRQDGSGWAPRMSVVDLASTQHRLVVRSHDPASGLEQEVELQLDPASSAVAIQARVTNSATEAYDLNELLLTVALPNSAREVMHFGGRWSNEFSPERRAFHTGTVVVENRSGRTSPHRFPALFAGTTGFAHEHGTVLGAHLGWSGNAQMRAEVLRDGRRVLQAGELLLPGEVQLAQGETYESPWLHLAASSHGLNGISATFHDYLRGRPQFPTTPRPVLLNTWEAVYFDHNLDTLKALADRAASIGVERFVLDDGWFNGRRSDNAGLGDWFVDADVWPDGLGPIVNHVTSQGMEFGLWFEPEMINQDSDVFRQHPDWVLHVPGIEPVPFRNQLVMDLTNPDAWDHLHQCMSNILGSYDISYVKWDMNRDLAAPAHGQRATVRQQVLAVYRLIDALRKQFPHVEIESCSSGGARADFEILRRTQRVWTSDCNDALDRQRIQQGFSYLFPPEIMGAHIGPPRAHTTGRTHSLGFRAATAFFGHLGIEWNVLEASDTDLDRLRNIIQLHKQFRPLLHTGRTMRLDHPDPAAVSHAVVSPERTEAIVSLAQVATAESLPIGPVLVPGLEPERMYRVSLVDLVGSKILGKAKQQPQWLSNGLVLSGTQLAVVGFQPPAIWAESAAIFHLESV